ncbi:unnamed protein product [Brassica oleracea]|uniref:(rape) hypothetical protein n=1 Tax=Brassica napus TaxID=3708 RepID=A0A816IEZ7_BRANA|nr:unnamed protein product [Brassica napus]
MEGSSLLSCVPEKSEKKQVSEEASRSTKDSEYEQVDEVDEVYVASNKNCPISAIVAFYLSLTSTIEDSNSGTKRKQNMRNKTLCKD